MKNDRPLPSLFEKGKTRKRKQTRKEKTVTVIGIAVLAAVLIASVVILTVNVINGQNDARDIEGYWYTESGNICWQFENGLARTYTKFDVEYTLSASGPYSLDADAGKLTIQFGGNNNAPFDYTLKGDRLTIGSGTSKLELRRGDPIK